MKLNFGLATRLDNIRRDAERPDVLCGDVHVTTSDATNPFMPGSIITIATAIPYDTAMTMAQMQDAFHASALERLSAAIGFLKGRTFDASIGDRTVQAQLNTQFDTDSGLDAFERAAAAFQSKIRI